VIVCFAGDKKYETCGKGMLIKLGDIHHFCAMEQETLEIFHHPGFIKRAKDFYESYDLKDVIITGNPNFSKRKMRKRQDRVCRFCDRGDGETTFSNLSHLLSKHIGNSNMYSDFECDECNIKFSSFEDDLAAFLGFSRSIIGLNKDKMTPGFDARRLKAKSRSFIGDNILIIAPEDVNREGNKTSITYTKNPFKPSGVYKALLKYALSLLSEEGVKKNYHLAISYLNGDGIINNGAFVTGYKLSFGVNMPLHIYIYEKRDKNSKIPTHILTFNFQNNMITLPIPWHKDDIHFYQTPFDIPIPPPYFTDPKVMDISMPWSYNRDFSSEQEIRDEEETITTVINAESLKDAVSYDPATDETVKRPYNPSGFKYIILTREGVTVDPKAFSAFIKEQMEKNN